MQEYDPLMTATICAVGPCADDRAPGSQYCRRHGPTAKLQARLDKAAGNLAGHQRTKFPWAACLIGTAIVVWVGLFFIIGTLGNALLGAGVLGVVMWVRRENAKAKVEAKRSDAIERGSAAIECPHCHTTGQVTGKRVTRKAGVDGAKLGRAMHGSPEGALGGMAGKATVTELSCDNCGMTWDVA